MTITEFTIYNLIQYHWASGDIWDIAERICELELVSIDRVRYYLDKGVGLGYISKKKISWHGRSKYLYSKWEREFKL